MSGSRETSALRLQHETSIEALDADEWDRLMGGRGAFDADALRFLETAFGADQKPENRWHFHYYVVRNAEGVPVLATFFTESLWKDDLAADAEVSRKVEAQRAQDPYFLTSRVLSMGSLLCEGELLYLDRSADWRSALHLLQTRLEADREAADASLVAFQDAGLPDEAFDAAMRGAGFVPTPLPDSFALELDFDDWESHVAGLSAGSRRFHRRQVTPFDNAWRCEIVGPERPALSPARSAHLYALYRAVQQRSFALNTFPLPEDFFARLCATPGFELLTLTLRDRGEGDDPQAFVACFHGASQYVPLVAGLHYPAVSEHGAHRQLLKHAVLRARTLGKQRVYFGMGAGLEKGRIGARAAAHRLYVQSHDSYQQEVLAMIASGPAQPTAASTP